MFCEMCSTDVYVERNVTRVTGDKSPTEQTVVYSVNVYACRNPNCPMYMKTLGEDSIQIYPTEEQP